jgi:hypothetical protein
MDRTLDYAPAFSAKRWRWRLAVVVYLCALLGIWIAANVITYADTRVMVHGDVWINFTCNDESLEIEQEPVNAPLTYRAMAEVGPGSIEWSSLGIHYVSTCNYSPGIRFRDLTIGRTPLRWFLAVLSSIPLVTAGWLRLRGRAA